MPIEWAISAGTECGARCHHPDEEGGSFRVDVSAGTFIRLWSGALGVLVLARQTAAVRSAVADPHNVLPPLYEHRPRSWTITSETSTPVTGC